MDLEDQVRSLKARLK